MPIRLIVAESAGEWRAALPPHIVRSGFLLRMSRFMGKTCLPNVFAAVEVVFIGTSNSTG
ncbi:predicted protein [Pyrenophora tritici-repentis Pt-1C-BFP]|uniref:Uncharacterized protein n=1 Tax=Pyrenophora tritici-repentis (strain Pt-1C-BFP) TaxID=426418 RepID=B2W4Q6_PYRTR|nr:uncharacterized protein PTRG_04606 [Pyrenophora tritici-repentis Pt-1C-BFP]EDU47513.1 predicted protein [Pyrenophora tritici-repentis Pt-1C-BFP]